MSEAIIIALIGGASGVISAIAVLANKIYDIYKDWKNGAVENRVGDVVQKIVDDKVDPIVERQMEMRSDIFRMRLLDLIRFEPEDADNILKIAKQYFDNMHCNSEATKQFARWLERENIKAPSWFKQENKNGKK